MFLNSGKQNKQINKKNTSFKNNFQWPVKNFPRSAQWTECKNTVKVSCKSFPYPTTSEATGQTKSILWKLHSVHAEVKNIYIKFF